MMPRRFRATYYVALGFWMILAPAVISALFNNGGFENGDFSSWTKTTFLNPGLTGSPPFTGANIVRSPGGIDISKIVSGSGPETTPDTISLGNLKVPEFGTKCAKVNGDDAEGGNNQNANSIKQSGATTSADVDPSDSKIHVRFSWAAVLENPQHNANDQPFFYIEVQNVTKATLIYSVFKFSDPTDPIWHTDGTAGWLYTQWQIIDQAFDSTQVAVGDTLSIEAIGSGCSLGGHAGYVYLDGFGAFLPTTPTPTPIVLPTLTATPPQVAVAVPTLSGYGFIMLTMLLSFVAVIFLRRL